MKKLIVLGMALALMLSVAPAMAGDFGALTASITPMTDSELASVQGARGGTYLNLFIGNIARGGQSNYLGFGLCVSQSNTSIVCQSTSVSVVYAPTNINTWIMMGPMKY